MMNLEPRKGKFRHTPEAIADMLEAFTRGKGKLTEPDRVRISHKHMITRQQVHGWVTDRSRRWGVDGGKMLIRRLRSVVQGTRGPMELKVSDLPLYKVLGVEQMKLLISIIISAMKEGEETEKVVFPLIEVPIPFPPLSPEEMDKFLVDVEKQMRLVEKYLAKAAENGGETESERSETPTTKTDDSESTSGQ